MATSRSIGSFGPPAGSDSNSNVTRRPASIVLDQYARIGGSMNDDTIATVKSNCGHIMDVSFWIHQPPALSYFCVHCHRDPNSKPEDAIFQDEPHVIAAEGRFVLLRARFLSSLRNDEYFMYKAGNSESGKSASLDRLPLPDSFRLPNLREFGIVPQGHSHYLVAALGIGFNKLYYRLHIYSSEHKTWRKIRLQNPRPRLDKVITSKVITLGEGILGWVDFQHGMLVCNLNETNPTAHYIPLPDPLPENKDKLEALQPGPSTRRFRDLVCINGVLKFIEMEQNMTITEVPIPKKVNVRNSDLIMRHECRAVDEKPKQSWNGWKAVVWSQSLSDDTWEMGDFVDAVDIVFDESVHLSLLSGLKAEAGIGKLAFKDLYSAFPTLSTDGDDILYLKSVTKFSYPNGRMVAVDLRTKRVMAMGEYCFTKHDPSVKTFGPCTLSQVTPGKVSASACVSVKQAHSSAHELKNASICVGHLSSREYDNKRPRLSAEDRLRKSTVPTMELTVSCKMIIFLCSGQLKTIWRPSHASIVVKKPATMGIHSNSLPQPHSLKADIQRLATANYSCSILLMFRVHHQWDISRYLVVFELRVVKRKHCGNLCYNVITFRL